jgi:hypothetical protein
MNNTTQIPIGYDTKIYMYVVLLHQKMILRSGHRFPANLLDLKREYKTESIQISDVNKETSLIMTRFCIKHITYLIYKKLNII